MLDRLRDRYALLLADQRRILRESFANWNGREVDTQGDAFFVSFSRATQAVSAAAGAQRALAAHAWPDDVAVRVRMGIHTGEPWSGEEGYIGMDVHRAARIYTLDMDELTDLARSRVARSLTAEECRQYLHVETCPLAVK